MKCKSSCPTRADLAGGTLDLWPLAYQIPAAATVNLAVGLRANVELSLGKSWAVKSHDLDVQVEGNWNDVMDGPLTLVSHLLRGVWKADWEPLNIVMSANSPAGAGLGGSSALSVALAAGLFRLRRELGYAKDDVSERDLERSVRNIESGLIKTPTGCQDYWGAIKGGLNILRWPASGTEVKHFDSRFKEEMQSRISLVYCGKSRDSAINNWEIFKRVFDGNSETLNHLAEIGEAAENCAVSVESGSFEGTITASSREWTARKKLWPGVETNETKAIEAAALRGGANLVRVCGAGGGGVMLIVSPPENRTLVESHAVEAGGSILTIDALDRGVDVEVEE